MASSRPSSRFRSSTSASNSLATTKAAEVLQSLLGRTETVLSESISTSGNGYPDIQVLLGLARQIHQHLTALPPPCSLQDDFRHLHGFQQLLGVLRSFSGFYNPKIRSESDRRALFALVHASLAVLSAAFRGHHGNRRYFRHRVEGGGWEALEQIIASIGLGVSDSDLWSNCQLFGKLLSFALDDQRLDELWQGLAAAQGAEEKRKKDDKDGDDEEDNDSNDHAESVETDEEEDEEAEASKPETSGAGSNSKRNHDNDDNKQITATQTTSTDIYSKLDAIIGPKTVLHNAEVMRTVVGFWESIPRQAGPDADPVSLLVLHTLAAVQRVSFANLAALHGTGILSRFLRLYFADPSPLSDPERALVLPICRRLMALGVSQLSDAQFLLASTDPAASAFCLDMAAKYSGPPLVQFDLSLCGHSSIELPNLGRSFPPMAGAGFTFTCWMRIDNFDPRSHTTIFGVFDASQTCFLLLYLERDTHNFILQTSVTSSRPSVRFRSVAFREQQWYHIALVHRRAKARASLYVNGEFAEQVRVAYPTPPPVASASSTDSFVSFASAGFRSNAGNSSNSKPNPVQAFLGTPKDLSIQVGPGLVFSKWSLASAHLFEDALSDDFLAVHYRLGPRYQANYQDSLGGFQTYTASARLALRNDFNSSGKDDSTNSNSDILRAIRDKASSIVPEQRILMSTLPRSTFRTDGTFLDSLLFRSLSRPAAANLLALTAKSGTAVAINGALPCINDALLRAHGVAVLAGDPVLATPFYFDDNLWRLAGFTPLALKLVERATTADELLRAAEMVFLCINTSWRNSDAMERDNGYAILGMLLRAKLGPTSPASPASSASSIAVTGDRQTLCLRLLKLVLAFVGYDAAAPLESLIINPLAYRILLVDFDTWRKAPNDTQRLYYEQFHTFAVMSKFHQFNSRRLLRMRITKRLLDAVKVETISEEIVPYFLKSFESLIRCNYNAEVHRSLALYITYAIHSPAGASQPRTPKPLATVSNKSSVTGQQPQAQQPQAQQQQRRVTVSSRISESSPPSPSVDPAPPQPLTKKQLGIRILQLYESLLCEQGTVANIRKFARTVTNKWLLYLLSSEDPAVVVSGCKILTRLLVTHGAGYTSKFSTKTGGFWIMAHRLKHWWSRPDIWMCVLAILFGKDMVSVDIEKRGGFDRGTLISSFGANAKVVYSDALYVVVALLKQGLGDILKAEDSPASPSGGDTDHIDTTAGTASPKVSDSAVDSRGSTSATSTTTLDAVIGFLSDLHTHSAEFRDFALTSDYVRLLALALFPSVVSMEPLSPEMELNAKDTPLRFDGGDVVVRQRAPSTAMVRTSSIASSMNSSVHSSMAGSSLELAADSAVFASTDSVHSTAGRSGLASMANQTRHRRSSSFILLTTQAAPPSWHTAKLSAHAAPKRQLIVPQQPQNSHVQEAMADLIVDVFVEQVLVRKEFPGFALATKIPPSFQEHQAYFESYLLRLTTERVMGILRKDLNVLCEPKVLTNMARFTAHMLDATYDGTFVNGVDVLMDFTGMVLEFLLRPDVASLKSVRLCNQAVTTIRMCFLKLVLFRLSDMDAETESPGNGRSKAATTTSTGLSQDASGGGGLPVLARIFFWQSVFIDCLSTEAGVDEYYMKLVLYQLYARLLDPDESVRLAAASIWRVVLVQKPNESGLILRQCATADQLHLARSFRQLTEVDDGAFLEWVDKHRPALDAFFIGGMSKVWEDFVHTENQRIADATAKYRFLRRRDKLKQWQLEATERAIVLVRHEMANAAWMKSIYAAEYVKLQRLLQDQQDDLTYLATTFAKMERDLTRPGAVFAGNSSSNIGTSSAIKWKLDRTEGRNRMRLRLLPDSSNRTKANYQSRQKAIESAATVSVASPSTGPSAPISRASTPSMAAAATPRSSALSIRTRSRSSSAAATTAVPSAATMKPQSATIARVSAVELDSTDETMPDGPTSTAAAVAAAGGSLDRGGTPLSTAESGVAPEDDFELIDDPNEPDADESFEDKNRKVMRRLEQGDVVQNVYNVSRIIGLDACEGILIVGKEALYLMDNVFQCRDGEIVNAWQAPEDERDPFSQIIATKPSGGSNGSGEAADGVPQPPTSLLTGTEQESRSWRWNDVISVSKRRFLFRDVAIEIFFRDGRSYLLTTMDNTRRDEVFGRLMAKIPNASGPTSSLPNPEDAWRLEALRVVDESPQTLGFKFGSIFNSSPWNPSMRRWQKGEISNFHYLMLVNTMAGRTFNDLTQYPVFPWVLADYTSEELDLDDPATFRDLSKPMGAQTAQRQADFDMRYTTLAEMGQQPFHYGTHYSSAMVVSSYLIRLPPFVQSFLLLQGGHFDHPDRLFASVGAAWRSASRDNGADVRELIPEFFCLPEFLVNLNNYDFGCRQDGRRLDNVELPPWAHGDPHVFIQKHRAALESPYVSKHLNQWIDLVFGHKQRGEAAVENLNVFHHLSYHGAIDLDNIKDPQERAIVTGIIHNFGQTPHQVFSRPHPARDMDVCGQRRLDTAASSLTRLPHPILESRERVASLIYVPKLDRLLCSSPFRLNLPPFYDKYLEWGYADNSIRFFFSDNRKPAGLFENLHIGQISCVAFADSKTLITAGEDCTVTVYAVVQGGSTIIGSGSTTAVGGGGGGNSNKAVELLTRSSLFGHKTPVTTVAVSGAFSTLVTVSQDGVAMLWDLNRLEFIRKLPGARPVECARINDVSGEIMLCSGPNVVLYSLNGDLLLDQNVCSGSAGGSGSNTPASGGGGGSITPGAGTNSDDFVHSCAFYEGAGNEWLENCLIFTGHRRGRVNIWRKTVDGRGRWTLALERRLDHVDPQSPTGANVEAAITCITPMPQLVYTGDDDGRVYEWSMVHRDR